MGFDRHIEKLCDYAALNQINLRFIGHATLQLDFNTKYTILLAPRHV